MLLQTGFNLGTLPILSEFETRSISPENPDGQRGGGARALPNPGGPARDLGPGWKARPCITLLRNGTVTLADIAGPGMIQHFWLTVDMSAYRDCVLRCYWDDEATPSVEVPLGDFFCNGHGIRYNVNSLAVAVNPSGGFNCYWPMPFYHNARITLENQGDNDIPGCYYQITYGLGQLPPDLALFHAQFRLSMTTRDYPEHVILDNVHGSGQYVGTYLAWAQFSDGWWGEGELKFYLDGDNPHPTICTTGTEDYFGGAWCFGATYSTPFLGYPYQDRTEGHVPKHGLYRWHIADPIRFHRDLKVTVQALGWWRSGERFEPLTDEIGSVGYWYQREPHTPFPLLLPRDRRQPRAKTPKT